ncbi:MAG: DUF4340 domain-containing protein [Rhodothermales bacterium]|nr:DUF4340 domain-containing protein [Rhodothermales bacterium]MBO6778777.1 DUF4340 domain-containing protein [Rhodothermales bacterium]
MNGNRLSLLAGALVVLLGAAWMLDVFDSEPTTIRVPEVEIPKEEVSEVTVQTDDWTASLTRQAGRWQLTEPVEALADSNTVNRLLNTLEGLELQTIVSTNPDRHERYGVDQASAQYLTVRWKDQEQVIVVAEQGPDFSSSYVRLAEDPIVYASSRITVPSTLDQLRDKVFVDVAGESVSAASVQGPEFRYSLERGGDSGWSFGDGSTADSIQVANWLRRFNPLRLDGFEDGLTADSLTVTHTVTLETAAGPVSLYFEQGDSDMRAWRNGGPGVMRAFGTRLNSLVQTADALQQ